MFSLFSHRRRWIANRRTAMATKTKQTECCTQRTSRHSCATLQHKCRRHEHNNAQYRINQQISTNTNRTRGWHSATHLHRTNAWITFRWSNPSSRSHIHSVLPVKTHKNQRWYLVQTIPQRCQCYWPFTSVTTSTIERHNIGLST